MKSADAQQLLRISQDAKGKTTAIRNQLAIDKASTKDTLAHAEMTKAAHNKILAIEEDAQQQAEAVKQGLQQAQAQAQETLTVGPQPPSIPTSEQVATVEAAQVVSDAVATGVLDSMP